MSYVLAGMVVWIVVATGAYWWSEVRQYRKYPHRWGTRHHGLLSFSDTQRQWMYVLWPLVVAAAIVWVVLALVVEGMAILFDPLGDDD